MTIKDYFSKNFKFHKKFYICTYNSFNSTEKKLKKKRSKKENSLNNN